VVVISDTHLGTYGCQAKELTRYLKSIKPKHLILNGDIIDIWQFNKRYWPKSHMQVIKEIFRLLSNGTKITYITGNHDEMLRKFVGFKLGKLKVENKVVLELDGKKVWIFHGDVFDVTMQYSKWLAKLGSIGYDFLIVINTMINWILTRLKKEKLSLSKKIKNSVKSAVKYINSFENVAAEIAVSNGYDYVICGHIHQPEKRSINTDNGAVTYLNSGDWIENCSALEYSEGKWNLYYYNEDLVARSIELNKLKEDYLNNEILFHQLVSEFKMKQA